MAWQDRAYNRNDGVPPMSFSMPPITRLSMGLILACLLVFLVQAATGTSARSSSVVEWGALTFRDAAAITQPWRWITYQYLHADGWHIFFNCIGIFFFVPPLERRWGWKRTLAFYTVGGAFAGLVYGILSLFFPVSYLIGASGSVLAAMGACALLFPEMQLILVIFPVAIRMAVALFAILYFLLVVGSRDLSAGAHLGGLAFGFLAPLWGGPVLTRFVRNMHLRRLRRETIAEQAEQESVDRILQKVHDHGMHSLNWRERRTLRQATERQRQRDLELTRRRGY